MMKSMFYAAAAALALTLPASGAIAQDSTMAAENGDAYMMSDTQQGMYDGWPADRQSSYDGWPSNYQEYYWSLTPAQQGGWWVLNNDQRARLYAMTPEQRTAAWSAIAAQMNQQSTTSTAGASSGTTGTSSGQMQFVSKEMAQPITKRTAPSMNADDLPVCTPNQQDGCINSWEKNKTGTKPLDHWPGKPASEMD